MFRGGPVDSRGTGITSGLDEGYATGAYALTVTSALAASTVSTAGAGTVVSDTCSPCVVG